MNERMKDRVSLLVTCLIVLSLGGLRVSESKAAKIRRVVIMKGFVQWIAMLFGKDRNTLSNGHTLRLTHKDPRAEAVSAYQCHVGQLGQILTADSEQKPRRYSHKADSCFQCMSSRGQAKMRRSLHKQQSSHPSINSITESQLFKINCSKA